jgi:hypothetical protein
MFIHIKIILTVELCDMTMSAVKLKYKVSLIARRKSDRGYREAQLMAQSVS